MGRRMATVLFSFIASLGALRAPATELPGDFATESGDTRGAQPLEWLKSGDYARLDRYYTEVQRKYEAGESSDRALYGEFRKLYEQTEDKNWYFDHWVAAFPASYAALLARGTYLYRMGSYV